MLANLNHHRQEIHLLNCYKYSWNLFWALFSSKKCVHNITLVAPAGEAVNANTRIEKYSWKSDKSSCWILQIQLKFILGTILIKEMRRQHHTGCPRWRGSKCHHQNWEIQLKNWQILVQILAVPNFQIGGARQAAVALQPMHVCKVRQLKSCFKYPDHSNNSTLSWVRAILKAQEASKVKNSCFKGIVHPTDIHGSWGTWLDFDLKLNWKPSQLIWAAATCETPLEQS